MKLYFWLKDTQLFYLKISFFELFFKINFNINIIYILLSFMLNIFY